MNKPKKIKINHKYPDNLQSYFASNFVVQHQEDHFILSFFEVYHPPIIGETEEEKIAVLDKIDHIDANCVARIVLTPEKLEDIIRALQENQNSFLNRQKNKLEKKL